MTADTPSLLAGLQGSHGAGIKAKDKISWEGIFSVDSGEKLRRRNRQV